MLSRKTVGLVWILVCGALVGCGQRSAAPNPIEEARVLLFQGKHDEAIAKCDELIRIDEHNFEAFVFRGEIHEKLDDMQTALADYSSAIAVAPKHPDAYGLRSDLYMTLSERAADKDEKFRLQTLAAADRRSETELNPTAQVAYKNDTRRPNPLLEQPIPKAPDKYNNKRVVEDSLLAKDKDGNNDREKDTPFATKDKQTKDDVATDDVATDDNEGEEEANDPKVNEPAAEYASRQVKDAADIRKKELGDGGEDELLLPPHMDPETATLPPLPQRPITRFSLPTDLEGRLILPQTTRSFSTGLTSTPSESDESEQGGESAGPNSRFFLQNQTLGGSNPYSSRFPNQQSVRTGIGSSQPTVGGGQGPRLGELQIGFMPPDSRNSFGPHLGPSVGPGREQSTDGRQRPGVQAQPENGTAILTTALPGTTMLYGAGRNAIPNTGNANLGQLKSGGMLQNGMTRSISDPSYTPFGARPALPNTNSLPATRSRTSSSN